MESIVLLVIWIQISYLAAIHIKYVVVGESLVGAQDHLRLSGRHSRTRPAHVDHFSRRLWAYPE